MTGLSTEATDYAYDFISSEKVHFHFGIWWQFWAEHGFPLCVAISSEETQSIQIAFREQYENRDENQVLLFEEDEDDGEWLVVGYKLLNPGTDCCGLIGKIVTDIEDLLRDD